MTVNADTQRIVDAAKARLASAETPHPTDAWERLAEQLLADAWKRAKGKRCETP